VHPTRPLPAIHDLTLDEAIGQTLCFGWGGENPQEANAHALELVADMGVGGLVLLGRNVASSERMSATMADLQARAAIPLLVSIDHEGGLVCRFAASLHRFPGNMALAAGGDRQTTSDRAYRQGAAQAAELRSVGVNWNLAPCLDVNNNPDNPVIGVRSYSDDPEVVGALGVAAIRGLQDHGVMACGKHFPGHGDTDVDSHLDLPTIRGAVERLRRIELPPFIAAINAGVGAIMTTHIRFPSLDPEYPATLSSTILTELLRGSLGYDGLIVTDCLEMAAIAASPGTPQGAVRALQAGADMVLVCHTLETQRATIDAIRTAIRSGALQEERIREAAARVLATKRRFLFQPPARTVDLGDIDALETEIARASITVVRGKPIAGLSPGSRVAVIGCTDVSHDLTAALSIRGMDAVDHPVTTVEPDVVASIVCRLSGLNDAIIAVTTSRTPSITAVQTALIRALDAAAGDRLTVAAVGGPYDIRAFPGIRRYICTYSSSAASVAALADALTGGYEPSGRLPVRIPGIH